MSAIEIPTFEEIGRTLVRHRVTIAWLTASLFHRMVDERLDDLRGLTRLPLAVATV